MDINEIVQEVEIKERKTKRRIFLVTLVPIISSILLLGITYQKVMESRAELKSLEETHQIILSENNQLKNQNDSLRTALLESTETLGRASSILLNFKKFVDGLNPPERSPEEAKFFIRFRMLEEKVRGDYEFISENISKLPTIKDDKTWIVIVEPNVSKEDLLKSKSELELIYGPDQVAIYRTANNIYALALKGNGSFTRAYRLNVELRDKHGYQAYFRGLKNWGPDYSK